MYVNVTIVKPGGNPGVGSTKKDLITLVDRDDIAQFPQRNDAGVVINGNIIMKAGTYAIQLYGTVNTIKSGSSSEGDIDSEGFIHNLEFEHPGNSVEIREFKSNWLNRNIIALVEYCDGSGKDLFGTYCAPLRMSTKWEDDKDKNKSTITLKSAQKSKYEVASYLGTVTYDTVKATVPADAVSVDLSSGEGQYQLTGGTAVAVEITTCVNPVDGMVFTLLGCGGSYPPQITSSGDFILSNGTTWSALSSGQITFRAFKSGASAFKFIEVSRH